MNNFNPRLFKIIGAAYITVSIVGLCAFATLAKVGSIDFHIPSTRIEGHCFPGDDMGVAFHAFSINKKYSNGDTLKDEKLQSTTLGAHKHAERDTDSEFIHLFYNRDILPLPECDGCTTRERVAAVIREHGNPDQAVTYTRVDGEEEAVVLHPEAIDAMMALATR